VAARALTPAQREVLDLIRVPVEDRPEWPATLRDELDGRLSAELADVARAVPDGEQLWIAKTALDAVHGCEARWQADRFEWSVPTARGRVAHKAIELTIAWKGDPAPQELVAEALGRLAGEDSSLADYLQTCGEAARADLAAQATTVVDGFLTTFPPLTRGFRPTAESPRRWPLLDDRIVLAARFDLTVGVPDGTTAGRVVVELKSGSATAAHADDLRFYALMETLVTGVPPLSVVAHYPGGGRPYIEPVTEAVLEAALRRTVAGVRRLAELQFGQVEARRRPGVACRWCRISTDCEPGRRWLDGMPDDPDWP
jgi:hypothetical protein